QGVGKTAIAEGLAEKIVEGSVPSQLKDMQIFSLDMGLLIAGTRYRGDFEERLKGVVKALEQIKDSALYIDEIHTIVGAGSTSGGSLDAANILKPLLTQGTVRIMGSTTFEEYKNHFEKDRALARRFLSVEINEPSTEETINILKGLKSRFEKHHQVTYSEQSIISAVELSQKFITNRFLPDKAIDVLDEAGALVSLSNQSKDQGKSALKSTWPIVKVSHIEKIVASIGKIPPRTVSSSETERLKNLEGDLKRVVFGQDAAIESLAQSIKRSRAGLTADQKPIGSFLFAGPTGVGKTEVAKQLALTLGMELIRFDMSEYMEKHSVARLIGAPPGYVGFDQGGLLTEAIIRKPSAVLLLDEIEKAHPDIFHVLLQVMDNATLTDTSGRKADFRNVILILTSNVGSDAHSTNAIGFNEQQPKSSDQSINKMFLPEFRNRLDKIVNFSPLQSDIIERVVDKFITEIDSTLAKRKVSIMLTAEARTLIAKQGYDVRFGGRSVHRYIQSNIKDKLADELLFGSLAQGGLVKVDVKDHQLELHFEPRKSKLVRKGLGKEGRSSTETVG
ncbi:AAA family ATPase, partial [bacterium]|nr:AAA family ATPase [bacterium]